MHRRCTAFDAFATDGLLVVSTEGDLWQRIPDPTGDADLWSYFGPIGRVTSTQLAGKLHPALARLRTLPLPSAAAARHAGT